MRLTLIRHAQTVANAGGLTEAHMIAGMRAFREFQLQLPMPNCAMFTIAPAARDHWCMESQPVADLPRQRGG